MGHANTREANTDLHEHRGSQNHQCITTKATVGGKQEASRPVTEPPMPPPPTSTLSAYCRSLKRRAVLDHMAAGD